MTVRRRAVAVVAGASVLAVGLGAALLAGSLSRADQARATSPASAPATASVERRTLNATTQVDGTLGYAGSYTITNAVATAGGTDPASAQQAYATAKAQVDQAVSALDALKHPTAADLGPSKAQLAQAKAAVTQASATLASDRAALASATKAHAPKAEVQQAQGRVNVDLAQLAAAKAGRAASQAALDGRQHPTAAQLQQANDAVASARAALNAARARLDQPSGVLTQIPQVGATVKPGDVIYTLDGTYVVVLMTGNVPAWRTLEEGVSDGADVAELETSLKALGYASSALTVDGHWDAETTTAVKRWQHALGVTESGAIPLGEVVFEPVPLRVTGHSASLGSMLQFGTPVLAATSTDRVISVELDPGLQRVVQAGDPVSVVLPDGTTATGKVSDVGTVAIAPANDNGQGSSGQATISMTVTLDNSSATGTLDQAPVGVNITTATAENVLAVPVGALVELLEGGYAVQLEENGQLRYVPVQLSLFAGGWVEVSGSGLAEGQSVVVAK
jgi:peptidoglycan hydrolase-like protein with peptidoglycan-binding domain